MRIARLESRPIGLRSAAQAVLFLTAVLAVAALAIAQPARADVGEKIILRCTHGQPLSGFSQSAYRQALKELSADTEEYSDCSSLIRRAQEAAAGGRGSVGAAGAGVAPVAIAATRAEQQAIAHAQQATPAPVKLGGSVVHPGVIHANIASAFSSMPTPLLATVAFVLVCSALLAERRNSKASPCRPRRLSSRPHRRWLRRPRSRASASAVRRARRS